MKKAFLQESSLQYRVKALERELDSFRTGEKYVKMKEAHKKETDALRREIARLKKELESERRTTRSVREKWFETFDEILREEVKNSHETQAIIEKLRQKCFDADMRRYDEKEALVEKYEAMLEEKGLIIEELKNRLAHDEALLNRDGTNTGIPTAQTPIGKKKVVPNSRRNTGNPKGGQPGHKKHVLEPPREDQVDDAVDHIPDPQKEECPVCGGSNFIYTGKTEVRYETDIEIKVHRTKHVIYVYQCADCGTYIKGDTAPTPSAQCQYGPNIKAIALSLMNTTNAAINKVPLFLSAITGGDVSPCEGYIAKLQKKASKCLKGFKKDLRTTLLTLRLLHWDDTVISIMGKQAYLRFYGDERISYYVAHEHKDLEGILEDGILTFLTKEQYVMHDHYPDVLIIPKLHYKPWFCLSYESVFGIIISGNKAV